MNDLVVSLRSALDDLAERFPLLDDLMVPRQAPSGENAGAPPGKPGSKPPLVVSIVDLKIDVEMVVGRWTGAVVRFVPDVGRAAPSNVVARLRWLESIAEQVVAMPWFERMVNEVVGVASVVDAVVDRPGLSPWSREIPEAGTAREIVRWVRAAGMQVSQKTVQRWAAAGTISSENEPDGRVLVRFNDVVEQLRRRSSSHDSPRAVS